MQARSACPRWHANFSNRNFITQNIRVALIKYLDFRFCFAFARR